MSGLAAEDRVALRDSLRKLLVTRGAEADVRRVMETAEGYDKALWRELADLGVVGLLAPEDCGGAGAGPMEVELVMEEAGAALLCAPLLSSGVLAMSALRAARDAGALRRLAPPLAAGTTIATLAITGDDGDWTAPSVGVEATREGGGWVLSGVASYVTDAQNADLFLVVARTSASFALFEVSPAARGVGVTALPTFDHTLRLGRITLTQTPGALIGADGEGWAIAEAALDHGLVALAGDQAGGAKAMLDKTVEYAKTRIQFGRAIGSFQAIKHMAADLLVETESSLSAARAAAQALAAAATDAKAAISLAAFACADAYVATTAAAVQMHGGIAFTWDHPAHLYLRRARAAAQLFGAPAFHRERYLRALGV